MHVEIPLKLCQTAVTFKINQGTPGCRNVDWTLAWNSSCWPDQLLTVFPVRCVCCTKVDRGNWNINRQDTKIVSKLSKSKAGASQSQLRNETTVSGLTQQMRIQNVEGRGPIDENYFSATVLGFEFQTQYFANFDRPLGNLVLERVMTPPPFFMQSRN